MDNAGGAARLVLVLESYIEDDPWINACLIGQAVDAAGDKDVRLDPEDTDVSFPVLVEADVVGPLFMVQLGPTLGALSDSLLDELRAAVYGTWDPSLLRRRGLPIMSRAEARWRLKEDEIDAMQSLASHCLAHHLARETDVNAVSVIVDPALLEPEEDATPAIRLLKAVSLAERERLRIDTPAEPLREGDRLRDWITSLGPDEWRALEPLWQGSLHASAPRRAADVHEADWSSHWPGPRADLLAQRVAAEARGGRRAFRVLTSAHYWGDRAQQISRGAVGSLDVVDVGRVQVKPELVGEAA
jgi:hypothetical protein